MFEVEKNRYLTKGITREIPIGIQMAIWAIIREQSGKHKMDYLQVFRLRAGEGGNLHIDYSQEMPKRKLTYTFPGAAQESPGRQMDGQKIYVIDDTAQIIMLLADEY